MRRREFITLLGGAVVAWPLAARAQQAEQMRRIGVLMNTGADEPESQARLAAFMQGLQELGWAVGRNLRIDYRWSPGDLARLRKDAAEWSRYVRRSSLLESAPPRWPCNRLPAPYRSSWHKASTL
jgi:putative tryptophan/tyrosine transport system substrate-binding protein